SCSDLENALAKASARAARYELELKALETNLVENLSNFRAVDGLLQDTFTALNRNARRADRALKSHVPHVEHEQQKTETDLTELGEFLPTIKEEVSDIKLAYDSGRKKAEELVQDLLWLDTDFYERWRTIIFTSSSPVSWRWKVLMRLLFAVAFIVLVNMTWIAIGGVYRAHRERLVWGERLMS
ncbi:hypothetical protein FIBSPDRAFT_759237, partial [Athelia psychrophila]